MTRPLEFSTPDDREERARAEVYALLAQLFHAPPPAALHERLRDAPTAAPAPGAFLERSWAGLVDAARRLGPADVAEEHDALFGGIGKPEFFLYASHHLAGALNEQPLVALRDTLAQLGLARDEATTETEDHLALLCDTMRLLITGDDLAVSNLAVQQAFFGQHLRPWAERLLEQLAVHPRADFYRALALFARDFFAVEGQAFDLLDAA